MEDLDPNPDPFSNLFWKPWRENHCLPTSLVNICWKYTKYIKWREHDYNIGIKNSDFMQTDLFIWHYQKGLDLELIFKEWI